MNVKRSIYFFMSSFFVLSLCGYLNAESNGALSVIYNRKSVRHYIEKPVSKGDLEELAKAGMAAPTAGDKRPWAFILINEKDKLNLLAECLMWGQMLKTAGGAIVVCGIPSRSFPGVESEFWIQDCSAATENILLAVEEKGLGAVWIGIHPNVERINNVRNILNIPPDVVPLNIISIGYPVGDEKPKNKFNPDNVHWNKW
jgi:nitroreductase